MLNIHVDKKSNFQSSGQENKSQILIKQPVEGSSIIVRKTILTPTPTPAATPTPTIIHTPIGSAEPTAKTATPRVEAQTQTQTQTQTTISNTSLSQQLLDQVNAFRASKGLSKVQTDGYTCAFATLRANEITSNFNHDGFNNRANSHTLPYPSYSSVTENIALNSDPTQVVPAWIASPGHNENMQKDTPNVCIANSGNYYAYEGWKP